MPSDVRPSRRGLLRAGAVGGATALAGCLGDDAVRAADPAPGTWPLDRHDARNTSRAPDASPPTEPTVERVDAVGRATTVLVGDTDDGRRVVVGGYGGVAAYRPDGTAVWSAPESDALAIRPGEGVCYAASDPRGLRALSLVDGDVRWQTDAPGGFTVVPSSRGPFLPFNGGIDAYDRSGDRRYRLTRGTGVGHAGVAVADAVYAVDVGMVERLRERGLVERLTDQPPAADWRVEDTLSFARYPVVADDEVYVTDEDDDATGGVLAVTTGGEIRWHRNLGRNPAGVALGPDRLFVAMLVDGGIGGDDETLFALDRRTGRVDWTATAQAGGPGYYTAPVVAGETLLVGGARPEGGGHVSAFTLDGEERWVVETESPVWDLAPAGDRVYASTETSGLYVLS
jgi:outer membrane protein assembly factor BamB